MKISPVIEQYLQFKTSTCGAKSLTVMGGSVRGFEKFLGKSRSLESVVYQDVNHWIQAMLARKVGANTIIYNTKFARDFFRWCVENKFIEASPFADRSLLIRLSKTKTRKLPFTAVHYEKMMQQALLVTGRRSYFRYACPIAWHTGMRLGDVCTLKWQMIDWEQEIITLAPRKSWKFHPQLEIPIEPELMELLTELRQQCEQDEPYVMRQMALDYIYNSHNQLSDEFSRKILDPLGFGEGYSFHCFRHAFVTRMLEAGVAPEIIGTITGQCVQQVMQYGVVTRNAKRNAFAQMREAMHQAKMHKLGIRPAPFVPAIVQQKEIK